MPNWPLAKLHSLPINSALSLTLSSLGQSLWMQSFVLILTLDLNSDHHLLTFSWLTMDVKAPPIKFSRTIWKLQRLQEKAVAKLYVEKFRFGTSQLTEDVTEAIQQSQLSLATLDNLTTQLELCIHQALTESVSISTPRPWHWRLFWNAGLQQLADQRKTVYRKWRQPIDFCRKARMI